MYRSKPIHVEAYQYSSLAEAPSWAPDESQIASKTDWAVRAENGDVRIFSDAEFQDTFEGATAPGDPVGGPEGLKADARDQQADIPAAAHNQRVKEITADMRANAPQPDPGYLGFMLRERAIAVRRAEVDLDAANLERDRVEHRIRLIKDQHAAVDRAAAGGRIG